MEEKKKIECDYTRNITCPYCGYEDRDSWELTEDGREGYETDCGRCERTFGFRSDVSVDYTSWKLEGQESEG